MHLASTLQSEIRATIDATIDMMNDLADDELDARATLTAAGFTRSASASDASLRRLDDRLAELMPLMRSLPDLDIDAATKRINEELTEVPIAPSVLDHDGVGPHIHWTSANATFDDQVIADILMSIAQELCDNGTTRFGRCAATDCDRLFYDSTRNRSRRFCSDPRCASRTHTADHRARQRTAG